MTGLFLFPFPHSNNFSQRALGGGVRCQHTPPPPSSEITRRAGPWGRRRAALRLSAERADPAGRYSGGALSGRRLLRRRGHAQGGTGFLPDLPQRWTIQ